MARPNDREVVGGFVQYFRECLELGTPCEGDGDLPAIWIVAARCPNVMEELLQAGIEKLFPIETALPTLQSCEVARQWGMVKF